MSATVTLRGPLFDGTDRRTVAQMCDAIAQDIAVAGRSMALTIMDASFRTQTPYYVTQVRVHTLGAFERSIDDGGVIYGPWLEGVGSRNYPTTRFKGYAMYRRTAQQLDASAQAIADESAAPYLARM